MIIFNEKRFLGGRVSICILTKNIARHQTFILLHKIYEWIAKLYASLKKKLNFETILTGVFLPIFFQNSRFRALFLGIFFKVDVLHASIWYWYSSEHLFYNKIVLGITFCIHICLEIPKLKSSEKSWKCTTPTLDYRLYFKNKPDINPFFYWYIFSKGLSFTPQKLKKIWMLWHMVQLYLFMYKRSLFLFFLTKKLKKVHEDTYLNPMHPHGPIIWTILVITLSLPNGPFTEGHMGVIFFREPSKIVSF